jgi:hypothetical protein
MQKKTLRFPPVSAKDSKGLTFKFNCVASHRLQLLGSMGSIRLCWNPEVVPVPAEFS